LDSVPARAMSGSAFSLFISDLHLTPERPQPVYLLQRFIEEIVPASQALYILGDFFEAWVGDDSLELPFNKAICQSLNSVSASGVPFFFYRATATFSLASSLPKQPI
jgi:UDP-2,3-diacylglucosamine hydrolase